MLEQLKYVNHLGETIEFGKKGIFANSNDLRNYEYTYDSSRNRAENFRKGVVTKTIPVVISAENKKKCTDLKNRLYEVCEKDIIAEQKGKLYIGDYYLECYVFSSAKSNYLDTDTTVNMSIKIVSDDSSWIREDIYRYAEDAKESESGKGYEYDYEYDYSISDSNISSIKVDDIKDCDFVLTFYGGVVDPYIEIDKHRYSVHCTVGYDERLEINSKQGTVTLIKSDGSTKNLFSKRNKESDAFQKIAPGEHIVFWGKCSFDLAIRHERGEPKWI